MCLTSGAGTFCGLEQVKIHAKKLLMRSRDNKTIKIHNFFYEMNEITANYELWLTS